MFWVEIISICSKVCPVDLAVSEKRVVILFVRVLPGQTVFTVIPSLPTSSDKAFAQPKTPNLMLLLRNRLSTGVFTDTEDILIIRPHFFYFILGKTIRDTLNADIMVKLIASCQS